MKNRLQVPIMDNGGIVLDALMFAVEKHEGQFRRGTNLPYITHPLAVSYIVAQFKDSKRLPELVAASILHDVIEDTETTKAELEARFGFFVASLVEELSSNPDEIKKMGKFAYILQKMMHMSKYALVIKLADRLHNISDKPTPKMLKDTIKTIEIVQASRKLTTAQSYLAERILETCDEKMNH